MKFTIFALFAVIAAVAAAPSGPVQISDNNVGDIVTVGVSGSLELSNHIDQNIISVIVALLNQQAIVIPAGNDAPTPAQLPNFKITPEMIENIKSLLVKEN